MKIPALVFAVFALCFVCFEVFYALPIARRARQVATYTGLQANQAALKKNPNDPMALRGMAEESSLRMNFPQAVFYLRQAVKIEPDNTNNKYLLGIALARAGSCDESRHTFEELASFDNPDTKWAQRILVKMKRNPNWGLYKPHKVTPTTTPLSQGP